MSDNMKLFLELGAKTQGFVQGLANSKSAVGRFTASAKKELASLRDMATSIRGQMASLGLTIGAGKLMLDSARLDKSLARIGQTAGAVDGEVGQLRKDLFGMARESGKVVEDLGDGFNALVQSGLNMKESTETLKGVNIAMAVTDAAAGTLASGLTVAAESFDFDLSKPGQALDMLDRMTVAGRLGNAELEDLSSIFARVGGDARRAGMEFNTTLAFVEGLSQIQRNPERLATLAESTLRIFNNKRYMDAAKKATKVNFFDAKGGRRDAFAVLEDIRKKYATLKTDLARNNFIDAAFGKADLDTIKGINTLLSGDSLVRIGGFEDQIAKAGGSLKRDFPEATTNLIDQAGMLKNDMREAADAFVTPIDRTLGQAIQWMRDSKEKGGLGLDGKDMILGGGAALLSTALAARYGGKAISGIAGKFLKGGGSLAAGVAQGKALEAAAGVTPVFVTNFPDTGGLGLGSGSGIAEGLKTVGGGKGSWLKKLGGMGGTLATAGGSLAGLAGSGLLRYEIGKHLNSLSGWVAGNATDGKYGGEGWLGSMLFDLIHGNNQNVQKTNLTVYVDKDDRITTKTDNMNDTIDASVKRGRFTW